MTALNRWRIGPLKTWSQLASVIVILLGGTVLIGWALNLPLLKSVLPGLATMKANTALCFVLTGAALWLSQEGRANQPGRLVRASALAILLISLLTLSEYFFGWDLEIDQFLFRDTATASTSFPGRMAHATAFSFTLLGLALWLLNTSRRYVLTQVLALIVIGTALLALAGYLYGVVGLYGVFAYSSVALHTALGLVIASAGILLVCPQRGLMAVITGDSSGGVMARRLLPAVVFVPLILGWLRLKGQQQGLYSTEFGLALFAVSNVYTFAVLVWWNARLLNRGDNQRKQAEKVVKRYAQRLEILHEIDMGIINAGSIQEVVEAALKQIRQIIPCQQAGAVLFDFTTSEVIVFAIDFQSPSAIARGNRLPLPPGFLEEVATSPVTVIDDIQLIQEPSSTYKQLIKEGLRASLRAMLIIEGHPIGVLSLTANTPGFFTAEHQEIAAEIASQLAIAIHQLQLSEELARHTAVLEQNNADLRQAEAALKRYAQRMEILHQIDLAIIQGGSIEALVEAVLKHIRQLIPCQRVSASLINETKDEVLVFAVDLSRPSAVDKGIRVTLPSGWLDGYDADHAKIIDDIRLLEDLIPAQKQLLKEGLVTFLHVVLTVQGHPIGLLALSTDTPGFFTSEYRQIAIEIANQLAIAIHQMHLDEALMRHAAELEQRVVERTAELLSAKERVEAILNNSADGILLAHPDFTIRQTNAAFNRLFACDNDDYFNQHVTALLHAEDDDLMTKTIQGGVAEGQTLKLEARARRKDDTDFDAGLSIGFIETGGFVCTIRDITERKQVENTLRESEERFRQYFELPLIGMALTSPDKGWILVNNKLCDMLGYTREELAQQSWTELTYPDDLASDIEQFNRVLAREIEGYSIDKRYVHKNGQVIYTSITMRAVRDLDGRFNYFVVLIQDISERKRAEDALRESEERFRQIAENFDQVLYIRSGDNQKMLYINPRFEALWGKSRESLYANPDSFVEIVHPDDLDFVYQQLRSSRHVEEGLADFEYRIIPSDQLIRWVRVRTFPIKNEDGSILRRAGIIEDITERKRVAAELEEQSSFLRNVIDVSPSMIFVKDYDARFILVNPLVAKMYNTTVEALIGKTDADFNPSLEEVHAFLEADRRVIDIGEPLFIEEPITSLAGETRWLQTTKVPIISADDKSKYVLGVATDITERKRAEIAMKESEEKYRSLIETMRGGLVIFDPDNRITYVNDRFCEQLGYSRDEVMGTRAVDYVDATDLSALETQLKRRRHLESSSYELLLRQKDGHPVYLLVSGSPLLDKNGEYGGSFAVTTDITAQKQAEETLRQAFEKEKELGELKTRFVSMASHEFRTPLATILALTETLMAYRHKLPEEQIEQRLGKIQDQVGHLKDIMEDVLLLARMQARRVEFSPVKLNLDDLCRSVLDEFQSRPDVTHKLLYTCDERLRTVTLDKKLMRQIINNLVSNAVKYSPGNKTITVSLAYESASLILKVQDEGIGIPEADLKYLFEPFHRAANVGTISGTGLGMVITKESVDLHGGTIMVESQVDVGTTFTVRIPISTMGENDDDENPGD